MEPIQTSLKKTQTNDILYSLLKEIDKYNDKQIRQKLTLTNPLPRVIFIKSKAKNLSLYSIKGTRNETRSEHESQNDSH